MTFWVAGAAVAGAAISGAASASASSKASKAQIASATQADATQRYQYDTTRADQMPAMERGNQAGDRLQYLLGLSPNGTNSLASGGMNAPQQMTAEQLRAELTPQFTRGSGTGNFNALNASGWELDNQGAGGSTVDNVGLEQAIARRMMEQQGAFNQAEMGRQTQERNALVDPEYGSLMRDFSANDLKNDPVYQSGLQFGLDEGTKGINRMAAAGGGMLSGATLKALTKYGNDYANLKGNESFNRSNAMKQQKNNMLAGVAGSGQVAGNQIAAAGQNMANNVSQSQLGAGNARAAGYIGQGNALTGAVGQGYNMYQGQQMMNKLFPQANSGNGLSAYMPSYAGAGDSPGWISQG